MKSIAASRIARQLVLFSLFGLILSISLDNLFSDNLSFSRWFTLIAPLIFFVPALLGPRLRPYQWLCFVILLYFLIGILYLFSPGKMPAGIAITCFCVLLFCSAIFYIHKQQQQNRQ